MKTKPRTLIAVFAAVMCVLSFVAPNPAGASTSPWATATPGNQTTHPWQSNGCGPTGAGWAIPNSIIGVSNFKHACDHHDGCYGEFKVNGVPTRSVSRQICDNEFLADMQASCRWQHGADLDATWASRRCSELSYVYYGAVRQFGGGSYSGPINN